MTQLEDLFLANATDIFITFGGQWSPLLPTQPRHPSPAVFGGQTGSVRAFRDLLGNVANELHQFLKTLREIPEFSGRNLTGSIEGFAIWLDSMNPGLQDFDGRLSSVLIFGHRAYLILHS